MDKDTEPSPVLQKKFRCGWRIGDVYAYQVTGDEAAELGILGSYFLFRKVDSVEFGDGRLLPVVTVHVWDQKTLPICPEDFAKAPMLKIRKGGRCGSPKEKHEYRAEILFKNRKQIDKMPLMFIGNYPDIEPADDEILFTDAGEMCMVSPEQIDKECCLFWKWNRYCTLGIAF